MRNRRIRKVEHGMSSQGAPTAAPSPIHPKNTLNDLTGAEWLFFTKSWLPTAYPDEYAHDLRSAHGANKPPRLMQELILFFTKQRQRVLDPFAGVGGTLIGASACGRRAIGIELNPRWRDVYREVCRRETLDEQPVLVGDARDVLRAWTVLAPEAFHQVEFICTDPPYNLNFERTMSGVAAQTGADYAQHRYRRTDYVSFSDYERDLSNLASYADFLDALEGTLRLLLPILIPGRYMAMLLRNAYQEGRYLLTTAHVAERAERVGFVLKGEKVWYQAGTRLRPYGYPRAYVPNISHQFILIFQRPA